MVINSLKKIKKVKDPRKVILVDTKSDLPDPIDGIILLEGNTDYRLRNETTDYEIRIG